MKVEIAIAFAWWFMIALAIGAIVPVVNNDMPYDGSYLASSFVILVIEEVWKDLKS